jgi:hypothetical protein
MTLPGETLYSGAPRTCEDCGVELVPRVCRSGAGFYIGTWCHCGPESRESGYFASCGEAEAVLEAHPSELRPQHGARDPPAARPGEAAAPLRGAG